MSVLPGRRTGDTTVTRTAGALCPLCGAVIYEWRIKELHYLDGRTEPYDDPIVSLLCDCGKAPEDKVQQLSLLEMMT